MQKPRFWPLLSGLLLPFFLLAQGKNEFKLGYGVASGTEFGVSLGNAIGTSLGAAIAPKVGDLVTVLVGGTPRNLTVTAVTSDTKFPGTFYVGYNRFVARRWSLGVQANYNPIRIQNAVTYSDGSTYNDDETYRYVSLYARTDLHYVLKPKFQMYSGIMGGVITDVSGATEGVNFAAHLAALGFRFGQTHGLHLELGIGFGPLLSGGYSVRF